MARGSAPPGLGVHSSISEACVGDSAKTLPPYHLEYGSPTSSVAFFLLNTPAQGDRIKIPRPLGGVWFLHSVRPVGSRRAVGPPRLIRDGAHHPRAWASLLQGPRGLQRSPAAGGAGTHSQHRPFTPIHPPSASTIYGFPHTPGKNKSQDQTFELAITLPPSLQCPLQGLPA